MSNARRLTTIVADPHPAGEIAQRERDDYAS